LHTFTAHHTKAMYGAKIRSIREWRGFSQENIAAKLSITQTAYSRIESNQTKVDTAMLEKLAKELGVSPMDIMSAEPVVMNFYGANHGTQGNFQHIEQQIINQKELYEKLLASKDEEVAYLKRLLDGFLPKSS
jgi:transcriptional regulator with XRE-family HTH domain